MNTFIGFQELESICNRCMDLIVIKRTAAMRKKHIRNYKIFKKCWRYTLGLLIKDKSITKQVKRINDKLYPITVFLNSKERNILTLCVRLLHISDGCSHLPAAPVPTDDLQTLVDYLLSEQQESQTLVLLPKES